jgi:hypothetical protein
VRVGFPDERRQGLAVRGRLGSLELLRQARHYCSLINHAKNQNDDLRCALLQIELFLVRGVHLSDRWGLGSGGYKWAGELDRSAVDVCGEIGGEWGSPEERMWTCMTRARQLKNGEALAFAVGVCWRLWNP